MQNDELKKFRAALATAFPTPPAIKAQSGYLKAAFTSRKPEAEVRAHFEAVWMGSCGQALEALRTKATLLLERVEELAAEAAPVVTRRRGRSRDQVVDSKGPARWNLATVFDMGVPLVQTVGLLGIGWMGGMLTLEEASDLYPVFESWTNRAVFTLLPALGLCAGWKYLGNRFAPSDRNTYWAGVTTLGVVLGSIWVVLFGLSMGSAAWDVAGGGIDTTLLDGGDGGGAFSAGVWLCITGILAETLLAAAAWRRFESELHTVFPYEVLEDPVTASQDAQIADLSERGREAKALHGAFLGEIDRQVNARTAYANEGVAALAPTWNEPGDGEGPVKPSQPSDDPLPPAPPWRSWNGNYLPDMESNQ